jgi:hypothetical protein
MAAAVSSNDRALFKKHSCQIVQRNAKQQVNGPDGRTLNVPVRGTAEHRCPPNAMTLT